MQLSDLHPAENSTKRRKRVGRGHACHGKTCCRGSNGQKSRSGGAKPPGFEGGQTPWYRRLPKYKGFHNPDKVEYTLIDLAMLESLADKGEITPDLLFSEGIIKSLRNPIKVLANYSIQKPITVKLHAFSQTAKEAIENAGGKIEVI